MTYVRAELVWMEEESELTILNIAAGIAEFRRCNKSHGVRWADSVEFLLAGVAVILEKAVLQRVDEGVKVSGSECQREFCEVGLGLTRRCNHRERSDRSHLVQHKDRWRVHWLLASKEHRGELAFALRGLPSCSPSHLELNDRRLADVIKGPCWR